MKFLQKSIMSVFALLISVSAFAQDFGFDDDSFGDMDSSSESSLPNVTVGGKVEMAGRAYVDLRDEKDDSYNIEDWKVEALPSGKLNFDYSGSFSDISLKLKFDRNSLGDYKWDILDEFTARAYVGNAQVEAGKMKLVWGKGDKLHVIDNFNANDYTDYVIPDYIDRRISEPMFRVVYSTNNNVKIEGVYTPLMTADRLSSSGVWQPKATKKLTSIVKNVQEARLAKAFSDYNTALLSDDPTKVANTSAIYMNTLTEVSSFSANDLYPDTYKLEYGQAGLRTTFTIGQVDLGLSYYYGHNKQPSVNLKNYATSLFINGGKSYELPSLSYDKIQVFGVEGAGILFGRLNSRFEFAYNMTEDVVGDDPTIHNNSIAWVGGFDVDLPISNININIQEQGKFILKGDEINDSKYKSIDVDLDGKDCYSNNKIVLDISDSYNHENIKLDIKGIWGIERGDIILMPSVSFKVKDDFFVDLSGMYIWCNNENSEFDGWNHNSFAQVSCKYQF